MTHIIIEHDDAALRVYFTEPTPGAVQYDLATFPISTAFTRRMAATVACSYSDGTGIPIDMESLSLSLREHCAKVERDGMVVTYRMKFGEPV